MTRRLFVAASLLLVASLAIPAQAYELRAFTEKNRKATMEELAPQFDNVENKTNKSFFEQYSFDLQGKEGSIWFQFVITNLSINNGTAAVMAKFDPRKGDKVESKASFERKDWNAVVDKKQMALTVGSNAIKFDGKVWTINLNNDQFGATIEVSPFGDSLRPGGGKIFYGKGSQVYYDTTLLVPRGEFKGTVHVKATGEKFEVSGNAFGDHSCWNVKPHEQARRWVKTRVMEGGHTMVVTMLESTKDYESKWVGFIVVAGKKGVEATLLNPTIALSGPETDAESGYEVPKTVMLSGKGIEGAIRAKSAAKRTDRLESLSDVEKLVVKNLAGVKPIEFKHGRSDYEFTVEKGGKKVTYKGKCTYVYEQLLQ